MAPYLICYRPEQNGDAFAEDATMNDDMGIFRVTIEVASTLNPDRRLTIPDVMVDTVSDYNWISGEMLTELGIVPVRVDRFETADGRILQRPVGFALIFAGGRSCATVVVFARPGEMTLLGAIGLEGMNLRVDSARRELIPAGPLPVAAAA
jgi:predicted aspartyl protease